MRHDKVHNLFGYNMTRAAGEAFERLEPDKRILMYSRSACIGMHRYGVVVEQLIIVFVLESSATMPVKAPKLEISRFCLLYFSI